MIDGGYAHNSPVEAAVLWGATHLIIIEASPPPKVWKKGNLIQNVLASFNHLHYQAQLIDIRAKGEIVVFSIAPKESYLGLLDFSKYWIEKGINAGENDASYGITKESETLENDASYGITKGSETPCFRKSLGKPFFTEVESSQPCL